MDPPSCLPPSIGSQTTGLPDHWAPKCPMRSQDPPGCAAWTKLKMPKLWGSNTWLKAQFCCFLGV